MFVNLFRLLIGYVKFAFTGGFAEGFINDCYNNGLNLKNIKVKNDYIIAQTDAKTYVKLHKIAYKHGGKVKIIKKCGVPFFFSPLRNRWGVFAGMLFFVFFISFMGGFIWNITVTGTDKINDAKIIEYLSQNGLAVGKRWADIDKENLEFSVLSDFEDVGWISINKFGSTAGIEINETVRTPNIIDNSKITNVKATKDGIIKHVTALSGLPQVKEGEAVTKGDLLISGVYQSEVDNKNHFTHAHGTVLAEVKSDISLNISREQNNKIYTNQKEYKSLYFFGLKIPFYLHKDKGNSDTVTEKSYFLLNSFRLPIAIVTEKENYYKIESKTLEDDELLELAKSEFEKRKNSELKDCNILTEKVTEDLGADSCKIVGNYSYIEDIGKEFEIEMNDDKDNKEEKVEDKDENEKESKDNDDSEDDN